MQPVSYLWVPGFFADAGPRRTMQVLHTSTTAPLALGVAATLGGVLLLSSWQASFRQSKPNCVAGDQPPNPPFAGPGKRNRGWVSSSRDLRLLLAGKRVSLAKKQSQRNCQISLKGWPCFLRAPRSRRPSLFQELMIRRYGSASLGWTFNHASEDSFALPPPLAPPESRSLPDFSQIHVLGVRYRFVTVRATTSPSSHNCTHSLIQS